MKKQIAWVIERNEEDGSFHYQYTLSGANGGALSSNMSHWILELSSGAETGDFKNMVPTNYTGIDTYSEADGNPYMGGDTYGYKWNQGTDSPQADTGGIILESMSFLSILSGSRSGGISMPVAGQPQEGLPLLLIQTRTGGYITT